MARGRHRADLVIKLQWAEWKIYIPTATTYMWHNSAPAATQGHFQWIEYNSLAFPNLLILAERSFKITRNKYRTSKLASYDTGGSESAPSVSTTHSSFCCIYFITSTLFPPERHKPGQEKPTDTTAGRGRLLTSTSKHQSSLRVHRLKYYFYKLYIIVLHINALWLIRSRVWLLLCCF